MCGRFTLRRDYPEVTEDLGVIQTWNQPPGTRVVAVYRGDNGHVVDRLRWGFVETWMKEPGRRMHPPYVCATMETALRAGSWSSDALMRRRCVVPADGWYEWPRTGPRQNDRNRPHFIRFRDDRLFGLAAIWTDDFGRAAGVDRTLAILTTQPNSLMQALPHERMPVIIPRREWATWLSPETSGRQVTAMMEPFPAREMEMWQVSPKVNNPRYNQPDSIRPV